MTAGAINVLLVEDNPADVVLIREAMERNNINVAFDVADSGPAALAKLQDGSAPELIILDLNIPGIGGTDVLLTIRNAERTRAIPVIIMTTSAAQRDIEESYARGANAYVVKPIDLASFDEAVASLKRFWFTVARLPGAARGPGHR